MEDYDLLIIDDLGAERNTGYAMEQMFSIIDSRYQISKPLIVMANLKLGNLKPGLKKGDAIKMPVENFAGAWYHYTIVSLFIKEIANEQEN